MKQVNRKKRYPLFNPDEIATAISQAVRRDLNPLYMSMRNEDSIIMLARRQSDELLKKYVAESSDQSLLEEKAFDDFLSTNARLANYQVFDFPDVSARIQRDMEVRDKLFLRARALIHFVMTPFGMEEWFMKCKNSSGSTLGVSFSDTSLEKKSSFPITLTSRVKPLFESYLRWDTNLSTAIDSFNGAFPVRERYDIVNGSRATTVDKTNDKRRMIAVEPTGNMFFQQGLMEMLYDRMKLVGLDVENLPTLHRQLAQESSITRKNATIDFSSASDCVSIGLLKWLLPPKWFGVIDQVRSPTMSLRGQEVTLQMISTMGNAVTFPLETLVFWAFAHAATLTEKVTTNSLFPEWEDLTSCSVFGDDCILRTETAPLFIEMVESVGFLVNQEKSCLGAVKFRESCGGDYHAGYDIRPYFLKAPTSKKLSSLEPWLYIILNSLLKKYITCFGRLSYIYDKELFKLCFKLFEKHKLKVKLVPSYYPDDSGLKWSFDYDRLKSSYDIVFDTITRSHHGTYSFSYCRFNYRDQKSKSANLQLAVQLKRLVRSEEGNQNLWYLSRETELSNEDLALRLRNKELKEDSMNPMYKLRRKGGYVVAKALTGHWSALEK